MQADQTAPPLKGPNSTFAFRGRVSFAELELARNIAALQVGSAEKQRSSPILAMRDALVYYAKNEYPTAYRTYLISAKGKARVAGP